MAKILEEVVVIKVSRLVKDDAGTAAAKLSDEVIAGLEQIASELVGTDAVVEVLRG